MKRILAKLDLLPSGGNSVAQQLRHEIGKIGAGVSNALDRRFAPLRTQRWDRHREGALHCHPGFLNGRQRFAIYLIYQPKGVSGSCLAALDALVAEGLAPLVVSNVPVSAADLARLVPRTVAVLERPNLGHDFGGYRDGIWWLTRNFDQIAEVLFLNDSFWFPARTETQALRRVLSADGGAVGLFGNRDADGGTTFLDSFFFLVRAPVFASAAFQNGWNGMGLYTAKRNVVRHCEGRLAGVLAAEGRGACVIHHWDEIAEYLRPREAEDPLALLDRLFVVGANRRARLDGLRAAYIAGDVTRTALWSALRDEAVRSRPFETFAYLGLRDLDYGILKKKYTLAKPFGRQVLTLGARDGLPFGADLTRELAASLDGPAPA